jgi:D-aminoacyl-tRNA deacylase
VVQRVSRAGVAVNGTVVGAIEEPGLLVLVGVTHDDTPEQASRLAAKLWGLRILDGEKSCSDIGAPLLVISQFTLYADLAKGRRPSWSAAAPGPVAEPLVGVVVQALRDLGARVETGVFGADMKVSLVNDGPVTIIIDLKPAPPQRPSSMIMKDLVLPAVPDPSRSWKTLLRRSAG